MFTLFFADSGERALVQGLLMGSVVAVITMMLLLLQALNNPFHSGVGGLKPVAVNRSLHLVDQLLPKLDQRVRIPCNAAGIATRA